MNTSFPYLIFILIIVQEHMFVHKNLSPFPLCVPGNIPGRPGNYLTRALYAIDGFPGIIYSYFRVKYKEE